jgi:endogenous inhibitor of DNA gyrase (YacG/DUF329 family)
MIAPLCPWCEHPFTPRRTGGKPQRFCSERCRREYERELRAWARARIADGEITPTQLQRVRSRGAVVQGHTLSSPDQSP